MYSCIYLFIYLFKKLNNQIELCHRSNLQGNFLNIHKLSPPSLFHLYAWPSHLFACGRVWPKVLLTESERFWVQFLTIHLDELLFPWHCNQKPLKSVSGHLGHMKATQSGKFQQKDLSSHDSPATGDPPYFKQIPCETLD